MSIQEACSRFALLASQQRHLVFLVLSTLAVVSVAHDLVSGRSVLRGVGSYLRTERPQAYGRAVILKLVVALTCGTLAVAFWR